MSFHAAMNTSVKHLLYNPAQQPRNEPEICMLGRTTGRPAAASAAPLSVQGFGDKSASPREQSEAAVQDGTDRCCKLKLSSCVCEAHGARQKQR